MRAYCWAFTLTFTCTLTAATTATTFLFTLALLFYLNYVGILAVTEILNFYLRLIRFRHLRTLFA
jgi:hypothetical protein